MCLQIYKCTCKCVCNPTAAQEQLAQRHRTCLDFLTAASHSAFFPNSVCVHVYVGVCVFAPKTLKKKRHGPTSLKTNHCFIYHWYTYIWLRRACVSDMMTLKRQLQITMTWISMFSLSLSIVSTVYILLEFYIKSYLWSSCRDVLMAQVVTHILHIRKNW